MNLEILFNEINLQHFDGSLALSTLKWNSRLKTSAGRFFPGSRKWLSVHPPKIEIAKYLLDHANAEHLVKDTLAHEMIHYWLWIRRRPYGHNSEFYKKMKEMGVSRYNQVPRKDPPKFRYSCSHCNEQFLRMRKIKRKAACSKCCHTHNHGKYDERFLIVIQEEFRMKDRRKLSQSVHHEYEEQDLR